MKITLTDDIPTYQGPCRMHYVDKCIVEQQIGKWLNEGIIQSSTSNYASPVVFVQKKDGSKRLCCDYRRLNLKIMRDNFPMPIIDDVLERLQSARVFTTLDLENGFSHVPVERNSRKFTSFVTHSGQYEFRFVPFGITNSPAIFSRFIFAVFREYIQDGTCVAYMDDLIIPSKDKKEGINKLRRVLGRAAEWKRCQFLMETVEFLGYVVERGTNRPSEHRSDSKMRHVDALSRVSCLLLEDTLHDRLQQAQEVDDWVRAVVKVLGHAEYEDFYVKQGVLYKDPIKELIVVPSLMENKVIRIAHKQGHFSVKRTIDSVLDEITIDDLDKERESQRKEAQENIAKIQGENKRSFNKNRKESVQYKIDEVIAIKRTQYGTALKLRPKFFGPYKIKQILGHDRYEVEKVAYHEGPGHTTTVAENMKRWQPPFEGECRVRRAECGMASLAERENRKRDNTEIMERGLLRLR
ncbi:uncharacterized protein LOC120774994 [Bactrocera tryoni]|uniref:uncharacterized protein LOC120774994 n=1 Tax=Bactrocera tryoni TaxID=59916 RepID=UPI001A97F70F|nr:uncharacterized protein LOC120774994 [Bactrocera tryoni]